MQHDTTPGFSRLISTNRFPLIAAIGAAAFVMALTPAEIAFAERALKTEARSYSLDGPPIGTHFRPQSHAVADFDGDGDLDVAHAYQAGAFDFLSTPRFSVSMNLGDGVFAEPVFYSTAGYTYGIVAADFDGDGDIDLALTQSIVEAGNKVLVFRNQGDGTFGSQQAFLCGQAPREILAADFDNDGDIDLATGNWWDQSCTFLKNDGSGDFSNRTDLPLDERPHQLAAADLNLDGLIDIVVAYEDGPAVLTVLPNDGNGGFSIGAKFGSLTAIDPRPALALGDVDGDGDIDILRSWGLAGFTPSRFTLYRNDGSGAFANGEEFFSSIDLYGQTHRMRLADANGDGHLDIVATAFRNTDEGWAIIPGNGAGAFAGGTFFYTGEGPDSITVADVSGDSRLDVIITNRFSKTLKICEQTEDGFQMPGIAPVGTQTLRLAAGDIDLDGDDDIVTAYSTAVHSLLNNGDGSFTTLVNNAPLSCMQATRLADLNGDAFPDLVLARDRNCPPYNLHTMINNGDGTFGPLSTWPLNSAGDNEIAILDWDNDGDMDIAVSESLGCPSCKHVLLYLLEGNGDGTFQPAIEIHDPNGRSVRRIEAADMNGDGNMDIVGSAASHGIGVMFGNGDGTFQTMQVFGVATDAMSAGATWIAIDDLNDDGHPDVAYAGGRFDDASIGSVDIVGTMLNDGTGALIDTDNEWAAYSPTLTIQYGIDTLDADGDGNRDIVLGTLSTGDVLLYRGNGDGTIRAAERYAVNGVASFPQTADFDLDGHEDVAVVASKFPASGVSILPSIPTPTNLPGDLDNDGDVDFDDFTQLLASFGDPGCNGSLPCPADIDADGDVDFDDFTTLLANWI